MNTPSTTTAECSPSGFLESQEDVLQQLNFRLPFSLLEEIRTSAAAADESLSAYIRKALEQRVNGSDIEAQNAAVSGALGMARQLIGSFPVAHHQLIDVLKLGDRLHDDKEVDAACIALGWVPVIHSRRVHPEETIIHRSYYPAWQAGDDAPPLRDDGRLPIVLWEVHGSENNFAE